jgi:hypothetical protein
LVCHHSTERGKEDGDAKDWKNFFTSSKTKKTKRPSCGADKLDTGSFDHIAGVKETVFPLLGHSARDCSMVDVVVVEER